MDLSETEDGALCKPDGLCRQWSLSAEIRTGQSPFSAARARNSVGVPQKTSARRALRKESSDRDMAERPGDADAFRPLQPEVGGDPLQVGDQVLVGQHHPLGLSGRPAGEHHKGQILKIFPGLCDQLPDLSGLAFPVLRRYRDRDVMIGQTAENGQGLLLPRASRTDPELSAPATLLHRQQIPIADASGHEGLLVKMQGQPAAQGIEQFSRTRALALPPEEFAGRPGSIGKPMPGVEAEICEGELVLRSPCVMKGYFRNEAATREKLREGWLFTGDAAHQDEDGCFYIDGRKDSMMIRAGLNIYPEEIEGAARECPGIVDGTAYAEREETRTRICLDYVGEADPTEVRKFLLEKLNPHALPDRIRKVSALPRTPSGKKKR